MLKKVKRRWKDFSVYSEVDEDGEITKTVESKHGSQGGYQVVLVVSLCASSVTWF